MYLAVYSGSILYHQTSDSCSPALFLGFLQFSIPMDQVQGASENQRTVRSPNLLLHSVSLLDRKQTCEDQYKQSIYHSAAKVACSNFDFNTTASTRLFMLKHNNSHISCRKEASSFLTLINLKVYRQKEWKSMEILGCQLTLVSTFSASQPHARAIFGLFLLCKET